MLVTMEMPQTKLEERVKHTIYVQDFFPENDAIYGKIWKNMVWPDRPR